MKKRDAAKTLQRNLAIFDYARKHGCAAAAKRHHQSERNIQRIMSRADVGDAISRRDAPLWLKAMREPFEEAQRTIARSIIAVKSREPRLQLVHQHLTQAELDELNDVSFSLVYELALYRHKDKRKRRSTRVAAKSQRQELPAK